MQKPKMFDREFLLILMNYISYEIIIRAIYQFDLKEIFVKFKKFQEKIHT